MRENDVFQVAESKKKSDSEEKRRDEVAADGEDV